MHDIFDPKLEAVARERGITLVTVKRIENPLHTSAFTMARSTDRSLFKVGVDMLYDLEILDERHDNMHHRNSGLDSTVAKLCATHDVLVGINLANLRTLDPKTIGRVQQNIALCRQHKAAMAVYSDAKHAEELPYETDVRSLLITLGMTPGEAKDACSALAKRVAKKTAKANA